MTSQFRQLPSVDKVLSDERLKSLRDNYPHALLVNLIREVIEKAQRDIAAEKPFSYDGIVESVIGKVNHLVTPTLRRVINASGVILHTNLGRAPLSAETIAAMAAASRGYANLEYDLDSGERGSRQVHIEPILCRLTGAEAALVVNNNAAAILLGLTALARRKEVIISRGQAVEIGGGFRIPDVMRQSGAKLVEVGTTNCTYITDYEQAITPQTAGLLRVHSSNFKMVGYTQEVTIEEMAALGKQKDLLVFDDQGSGCFLDTAPFGLLPEPMVQKSVAAGASLVFFSGDKLVGGPQAGIIVGTKPLIDKLKQHPLARAMRIDKVRLAGLVATLTHYLKGEALTRIPIWQMIAAPLSEINQRAKLWADALGGSGKVVDGESMVGGGSLPGATLPTRLVAITFADKKGTARVQKMAASLRSLNTPIIGRIENNVLLLDPRSVLPEEDETVVQSLRELTK